MELWRARGIPTTPGFAQLKSRMGHADEIYDGERRLAWISRSRSNASPTGPFLLRTGRACRSTREPEIASGKVPVSFAC